MKTEEQFNHYTKSAPYLRDYFNAFSHSPEALYIYYETFYRKVRKGHVDQRHIALIKKAKSERFKQFSLTLAGAALTLLLLRTNAIPTAAGVAIATYMFFGKKLKQHHDQVTRLDKEKVDATVTRLIEKYARKYQNNPDKRPTFFTDHVFK